MLVSFISLLNKEWGGRSRSEVTFGRPVISRLFPLVKGTLSTNSFPGSSLTDLLHGTTVLC